NLLETLGKPLPVRMAARLVVQGLRALAYAHERKIVHRDIKPANLLLTNWTDASPEREALGPFFVQVADFGLARLYQASRLSGLTLEGEYGSTLGYLAPEQLTSFRHSNPAADQYAMAATLYHLVTGHLPFDFPEQMEDRLA